MAKKKLNSVVGIDIGSHSIKVAEIRASGRQATIQQVAIAPTPDNLVDQNGVYDTDVLGAVIKELCQRSGIATRDAVFSIAGQASILVRTLEVPRMSEAELKQHMEWEIGRNQPFAESTVVSDYKAFPVVDPAAQNMDVVMAIAAQSADDTLMGIGKKSGKAVAAIDVQPLALARSIDTSYANDVANQSVCVIDVGHKSTAINVFLNGHLLLTRQVPGGGEALTQAISGAMGVSLEEAERLKCEQGDIPPNVGVASVANPFLTPGGTDFQAYNPFADDAYSAPQTPNPTVSTPAYDNPFAEPAPSAPGDPYSAPPVDPYSAPPTDPLPSDALIVPPPLPVADAGSPIYAAMAREIEEFVAEARRSIDYFRSKGGDVSRVYLAGGAAKLKGLDGFLGRSLGLPVEMYDPFRNTLPSNRLNQQLVDQSRPDFSVAIGNALHIIYDDAGAMRLNLVPATVKTGSTMRTMAIAATLLVLASIGGALAMAYFSQQRLTDARNAVAEVQPRAAEAVATAKQAQLILDNSRVVVTNLKLHEAMVAHNSRYTRFYQQVAPFMPSFMRVTSMQVLPVSATMARLNMTGVIRTQQQYADLALALLRIPGAAGVSRTGFASENDFVPGLVEEDQIGRVVQAGGLLPLPEDAAERVREVSARASAESTGFADVSNFGSATESARGPMPRYSEVAVSVLLNSEGVELPPGWSFDFTVPNPAQTLAASAGGGAAAPGAAPGGAPPAPPGGRGGAPPADAVTGDAGVN